MSFPGLNIDVESAQIWWQSSSSASHSTRCQSVRLVACQLNENPVKLVVWATCWDRAACWGFLWAFHLKRVDETPDGQPASQTASLGRFAHGWLTGWFLKKEQPVQYVSDACICIYWVMESGQISCCLLTLLLHRAPHGQPVFGGLLVFPSACRPLQTVRQQDKWCYRFTETYRM